MRVQFSFSKEREKAESHLSFSHTLSLETEDKLLYCILYHKPKGLVCAFFAQITISYRYIIFLLFRALTKEEWKFAHSASQQTWLSSEDGHPASGKLEAVSNRAGL